MLIKFIPTAESSLIVSGLKYIKFLRQSESDFTHSISGRIAVIALAMLATTECCFHVLTAVVKTPFAAIKLGFDAFAKKPSLQVMGFEEISLHLHKVIQYIMAIFLDTGWILIVPEEATAMYVKRGLCKGPTVFEMLKVRAWKPIYKSVIIPAQENAWEHRYSFTAGLITAFAFYYYRSRRAIDPCPNGVEQCPVDPLIITPPSLIAQGLHKVIPHAYNLAWALAPWCFGLLFLTKVTSCLPCSWRCCRTSTQSKPQTPSPAKKTSVTPKSSKEPGSANNKSGKETASTPGTKSSPVRQTPRRLESRLLEAQSPKEGTTPQSSPPIAPSLTPPITPITPKPSLLPKPTQLRKNISKDFLTEIEQPQNRLRSVPPRQSNGYVSTPLKFLNNIRRMISTPFSSVKENQSDDDWE